MRRHIIWLLVASATMAGGCSSDSPVIPTEAAYTVDQNAHYIVTDLGPVSGGGFSQAQIVGKAGAVVGITALADGMQHAALWTNGVVQDIGPAGVNSGAFGISANGQVAMQVEVAEQDPFNENFCGYFTGLKCRSAVWQDGHTTLLPLLGGNNGTVGNSNAKGQIVGISGTDQPDAACPAEPFAEGVGPLHFAFKPVTWDAGTHKVRELRLPPGDKVGQAIYINDNGQIVGATGTCDNTVPPPFPAGKHAVLWETNGSVVDLGSLGGTPDPSQLAFGNTAISINNRGQVVGNSPVTGNAAIHGFIWTRASGMRSLDPLPGELNSGGLGINDRGDAVGLSWTDGLLQGNSTAVIWRNGGAPIDLNTLVSEPTTLVLLIAHHIGPSGHIVGMAFDTATLEVHGFVATPSR